MNVDTNFKECTMPNPFVKRLIVFCLMLLILPTSTTLAASVVKDPVLTQIIRTKLKLSVKMN